MRLFPKTGLAGKANTDLEVTVAQIRDYAERGLALGAQRMLIFTAALILQAFYLDIVFAAISTVLIVVAEIFDGRTFLKASKLRSDNPARVRRTLRHLHIGALFGASVISFFALSVAFSQHSTTYFLPMMFLMAATVFAATNTHQLVSVLVIRLAMYGITFVSIPLLDLISSGVTADAVTWLNFFTSLFVLYFMIDCSVIGLRYYRTNRRQLDQLRIENARTSRALTAKTEFLSIVSHELRTPLTSVRASLDMSLAGALGPMPEKSTKVLVIAQRNAARLGKLIDELLDLQKIEIGKMNFDFCEVQLSRLLSDAMTDNLAYAQDLGITLGMQPVATDLMVRADPMRLEQVITNLLSNAAKFSPAGGAVTLGVSASATALRINVSDNGPGVDPADREKVFASFSQLDNVDTRKVGGTGLGLSISKQIIEAHGGTIDFEPNPSGIGTTFFVTIGRLAARPQSPYGDEAQNISSAIS